MGVASSLFAIGAWAEIAKDAGPATALVGGMKLHECIRESKRKDDRPEIPTIVSSPSPAGMLM
jgi:hypothetical protein